MKKAMIVLVCTAMLSQIHVRQAHAVDFETIGTVAKAAYEIYDRFLANDLSLDDALDQILDAITEARDAILAHMDDLAAIPARTCAKGSVDKLLNLQNVDPTTAEGFASDMGDCVFLIGETIAAEGDPAIVDELGFTVQVVAPMALMAYEYTGLSPDVVVNDVLATEDILDEALEPNCHLSQICEELGQPCECQWRCTAYNGDTGFDFGSCAFNPPERAVAVRQALRNTSAAISSRL